MILARPLIYDSEINKWMDEDTAKRVRELRGDSERGVPVRKATNKLGRTYRFKPKESHGRNP